MAPNPPVTFLITPERIGRDKEPQPFRIGLGTHVGETADVLAMKIKKHVRKYLVSADYDVDVRLDTLRGGGTFTIQYGRYGKGTFETIQEQS